MRSLTLMLLALLGLTVLGQGCGSAPQAALAPPDAAAAVGKPQATCPIMGGAIDRAQHVDALGKRIYLCCPGCAAKVRADPVKALATLQSRGEVAEPAPSP